MDIYDAGKRSRLMSQVRARNTAPEMQVRAHLHCRGLRYRLHGRELPGKPDLVFSSRRLAVFVHGCFWHGHEGCRKAKLPRTRTGFWAEKIGANRARDQRRERELTALGWKTMTIWECELSTASLDRLYAAITSLQSDRKNS